MGESAEGKKGETIERGSHPARCSSQLCKRSDFGYRDGKYVSVSSE